MSPSTVAAFQPEQALADALKAVDIDVADFQPEQALADALNEVDNDEEKDLNLKTFEKETTTKADPNKIVDKVGKELMSAINAEDETEYDILTDEAKNYFGYPIAVVSFTDVGRQKFKSIQGWPEDESTPRGLFSFCSHVVKGQGCMVVPDATKDDRFNENPLVTGGPKIRFYAGAPLVTPEGAGVGNFCVMDTEAHPEGLTKIQMDRLEMFAKEAILHYIM
jgi:GAF domain-containing protein